jgi:hypothetical protein
MGNQCQANFQPCLPENTLYCCQQNLTDQNLEQATIVSNQIIFPDQFLPKIIKLQALVRSYLARKKVTRMSCKTPLNGIFSPKEFLEKVTSEIYTYSTGSVYKG